MKIYSNTTKGLPVGRDGYAVGWRADTLHAVKMYQTSTFILHKYAYTFIHTHLRVQTKNLKWNTYRNHLSNLNHHVQLLRLEWVAAIAAAVRKLSIVRCTLPLKEFQKESTNLKIFHLFAYKCHSTHVQRSYIHTYSVGTREIGRFHQSDTRELLVIFMEYLRVQFIPLLASEM